MKKIWQIETTKGTVIHEYDAPENVIVENTVSGEISRREITVDEYAAFLDSQQKESQRKEK